MDTTQIKQKIHDYVDQADDRFLTLINEMIDADKGKDWWDSLHPNIQASIDKAIDQSEQKDARPHQIVMSEIRSKYQK